MAEPTSTAAATIAAASLAVPALTAFGVPLGLRADLLIAGFGGALVAIVLLNSVPASGDTWRELLRTTIRRMAVACTSSLTAGYLAPVAPLVAQSWLTMQMPDPVLLGCAFVIGAGAQKVLRMAIRRVSGATTAAGPGGAGS